MPNPTTTTPSPASDADALHATLAQGFALKAAGKLTVDDPVPPGFSPPPSTDGAGAADTIHEPSNPSSTSSVPDTSPPPSPAQRVAPRPGPPSTTPDAPAPKPGPPTTPAERRTATAQQWKEVNDDRARLRAQVAEFEREKAEWSAKQQQLDELPRIKGRAEELDKILRQVAAERHPDLIAPIQARAKSAIDLARSVVPGDQADTVEQLLRQPDSPSRDDALEEVLSSLKTVKRSKLERAIGEWDAAVAERGQLVNRSQEAFAARQEQLRQQHAARVSEFEAELADWTNPANKLDILIEKPGDAAHNERRAQILGNARALFNGEVANVRDLARAAMWSSFGEAVARQNLALKAELDRVNAEVTALKGGGPGLENTTANGDAASAANGETDTKPADMPLSQWITQQAQREGISFGASRY